MPTSCACLATSVGVDSRRFPQGFVNYVVWTS